MVDWDGEYSRIYHSLLADEKMRQVFRDKLLFGWWVTLLIRADQSYPAPAAIPRGLPEEVEERLVELAVVDLVDGDMYRIHGLEKERSRRSSKARDRANQRWHPDMPPHPSDDAQAMPEHPAPALQAKPSIAKPSIAEPSMSRAEPSDAREATWSICLWLEEATGYPFQAKPGSPVFEKLAADIRTFGPERVRESLAAAIAAAGGPTDGSWAIHEAHKRLMPRFTSASDRTAEDADRKAREVEQAAADRLARQRERDAPMRRAMGYAE